MCLPAAAIGIISLGMGVLSSVAQYQQQQTQYAAEQTRYNQNYQNSLASGRDDFKQLQQRQLQEQKAYAQKDATQTIEGAKRAAEGSVQAAGSGVSGLSVDNIIADIHRTTATNRATLQQNYEGTAEQLQAEMDASVNKTQTRINQVPQPIAPSPLGLVTGIVGSGLRAFGGMNNAYASTAGA